MDEIENILEKQFDLLEQIGAALKPPGTGSGALKGEAESVMKSLLQSVRDAAARLQAAQATPAAVLPALQQSREAHHTVGRAEPTGDATMLDLGQLLPSMPDMPAPRPLAPAAERGSLEEIQRLLAQISQTGTELLHAAWAIHGKVQPGGAG